MEMGNLAGLRTFRVLRALKTVSIMPGTVVWCVCELFCPDAACGSEAVERSRCLGRYRSQTFVDTVLSADGSTYSIELSTNNFPRFADCIQWGLGSRN
jgi:hypothetical protein